MQRLVGSGFLLCCALLGFGCFSNHEPVTVVNDMEFQVAISRCESKDATADPVLIPARKSKVIRPGAACIVRGPAEKKGFLNGVLDPGPYIGCLLIPADSAREGVRLAVSKAEKAITAALCDETGLPK